MQTVEDAAGDRFLLLKRSSDAWLVRDPATGAERYREPEALSVVEGAPPLAVAAAAVPAPAGGPLAAVPDERALGLVVTAVDDGPLGVRDLLDSTTLCESDLHGLLGELTTAALLDETDVAGERGYDATPAAREAVAELRA